jgi:hypothetical protein
MATAPTPHTPLPTAPSQSDRPNFAVRAEAFAAAQETFGDEMDALAQNAYANALEAASVAAPVLMTFDNPTTIADPGAGKILFNNPTLAFVTSIAIDLSDNAGNDLTGWLAGAASSTSTIKSYLFFRQGVSGKYAIFAVTGITSPTGYRQFTVSFVAGSSGGFTDDALTAVGYSAVGNTGTPTMPYEARAVSGGLTAFDVGKLIDYTSGTGLITFASAAALGANFYSVIRNSTTAVLTLAGGVDGLGVTYRFHPGDVVIVQSDGTSYHYVPIKSGNWRLWSTTAVASPVASVAFTGLPQTARNLALEIKGASHNNGSNTTLGVSFSNDGSSYVGPYLPSDSVAAAATVSGKVLVHHYVSPNWVAVGGAFSAAQAGAVQVIPNSAALSAIRAQFAAGSIDAGTFELWIED